MNKLLWPPLLTLLIGACATVPAPLVGDYARINPRQAGSENIHDQRIRWGGEIIKVDPQTDRTCFEILSRELSSQARPLVHDDSAGRFIACRAGFYDPVIFASGREITVTGTLTGSQKHPINEFDYTYPLVKADVIYLWPKRQEYFYNDYEPWPWFYGSYGWGWWTAPPAVIIHHRPPPHRVRHSAPRQKVRPSQPIKRP